MGLLGGGAHLTGSAPRKVSPPRGHGKPPQGPHPRAQGGLRRVRHSFHAAAPRELAAATAASASAAASTVDDVDATTIASPAHAAASPMGGDAASAPQVAAHDAPAHGGGALSGADGDDAEEGGAQVGEDGSLQPPNTGGAEGDDGSENGSDEVHGDGDGHGNATTTDKPDLPAELDLLRVRRKVNGDFGTIRTRDGSHDSQIPANKALYIRDGSDGFNYTFKPEDFHNEFDVVSADSDPTPAQKRPSMIIRYSLPPPLRKRHIKKLRQAKVPWGSKKPAHG